MCNFFSFVTQPSVTSDKFYFDWEYRKVNLDDMGLDSHSHICHHYKLNEDKCNKWEYNPLTGELVLDMQNDRIDDTEKVERWINKVDWKTIVEPLVIKPIVHPLKLPAVEKVTEEQITLLHKWASVWASVGASVWDSVWDSVVASVWASVVASVRDLVWDSVGASVVASVWASVWSSVWASVVASVGAYSSAFFAVDYKHNFASGVKLWEAGLVPSFDGTVWRLHSGEKAEVVYEWMPEVQE